MSCCYDNIYILKLIHLFQFRIVAFVSIRALAGHKDGNVNLVEYRGSGTGGLSELVGHLKDNEVMYALGKILLNLKKNKGKELIYE